LNVEVRVLGPVGIWAAGVPVPAGEPRQRAVLAALAVEAPHTVSAEALVDRVWGESPPRQARRALHAHLSRVRALLATAAGLESGAAPARLLRSSGGYALDVDPRQVDVLHFRQLLAWSRDRSARPAVRAARLRQALALWQGPPLAGVTGAWAERMRQAWEQDRLEATLAWADAEVAAGNATAVLGRLTELAAEQPLLEPATAVLMRAAHAAGRTAEALAHYDAIRRRLRDELGADPGAELRALHRAVLRGEAPAGDEPAAPAGADPAPAQLPPAPCTFIDRSAELAALDGATRDGGPPVVVISGTAGVGKTALALHWAQSARTRFPGGQLYVDLRGFDTDQPLNPADVLAAFLTAFAPSAPAVPLGLEERAARFRTEAADRRLLVVLDNAATVEQVRPLLPGGPGCLVLVTSRDALAGLVALHGAHRLDLDLLPPDAALDLLHRLAGPRVAAEPDAARTLADQCGRLPLALRVAAERVSARPAARLADVVAELADRQRRLDLLTAGGDPRAAVREVFSWSVRGLPAADARLFALLGLHPGPHLDEHSAAALADLPPARAARILDGLARANLVQPVGARRVGLHDLLRTYAADLAHDGDEARAATGRLVDLYLAGAAAAMDRLYPAEAARRPRVPAGTSPLPALPDRAAALAWLDAELECLVAIAAHTAAHGRPEDTVRLSALLFRCLDGGHPGEAQTVHELALGAARGIGDVHGEALALNALGGLHRQAGARESAAELLRLAMARFRESGDRTGEARALVNTGDVEAGRAEFGEAARCFATARAVFRGLDDTVGEAHSLTRLGAVEERLGRVQSARTHLLEALEGHRRAGHSFGEAWALTELGRVEGRLGRHAAGAGHLDSALTAFDQLGDRDSQAWAIVFRGDVERWAGRPAGALDLHERAAAAFVAAGDREGEAWALNGLGEASLECGLADAAAGHHRAALAVAEQTGAADQRERATAGIARAARRSHLRSG
jgi:DNA-binding SARP family transcriptional activator/tetratricopeptide (TPR) repeat protein